jgi:hypothetical protein
MAQVLVGYRASRARAAFQYAFQRRRAESTSTSPGVDLDVYSGFVVYDVTPRKASLFVRVDRFNDPCADCAGIDYLPIDTRQPFTLTLAGVEFYIHPAVRLSPNVEYVAYDSPATGARPANDVAARLTFYWVW